jgi:hypothetical protein
LPAKIQADTNQTPTRFLKQPAALVLPLKDASCGKIVILVLKRLVEQE